MSDAKEQNDAEPERESEPEDAEQTSSGRPEPKELFTENPNKHVFICPVGVCSKRAQYTNGRTYASPMNAKEFIETHIALDHDEDEY